MSEQSKQTGPAISWIPGDVSGRGPVGRVCIVRGREAHLYPIWEVDGEAQIGEGDVVKHLPSGRRIRTATRTLSFSAEKLTKAQEDEVYSLIDAECS